MTGPSEAVAALVAAHDAAGHFSMPVEAAARMVANGWSAEVYERLLGLARSVPQQVPSGWERLLSPERSSMFGAGKVKDIAEKAKQMGIWLSPEDAEPWLRMLAVTEDMARAAALRDYLGRYEVYSVEWAGVPSRVAAVAWTVGVSADEVRARLAVEPVEAVYGGLAALAALAGYRVP